MSTEQTDQPPFTHDQIMWLAENLSIKCYETRPFSNSNSVDVTLELRGSTISFAHIHIPDDQT